MGVGLKRLRKSSDSNSDYVLDNRKLMMKEKDLHYDEENVIEEEEDEGIEDDEESEEWEGEKESDEESEDGDGQNDDHKIAEMEDLEKEYQDLRNQELDLLKNIKQHKDEDLLKGQAVKNQKALWDKTLEFRFLLQKAFSSSNRLPPEPIRSSFCDSSEVGLAYANLITSSTKTLNSLHELQEALLEKNPSISQPSNGNSVRSATKQSKDSKAHEESDQEWLRISEMHKRISPFRDKSIDKWQRKTQVTTGAAAIRSKLQAFNQNVSEQVAAYMRDPSRMLKQMQLRRSTVGVFGGDTDRMDNGMAQEARPDGDPELLDDSEFYQQLLKEFFETVEPTSTETAFYALKRMQSKKRKIVDRRASKSRKIRYNVHEKIVNFMAPRPMNLPLMAPKLFENLFGLKA